jgi:hypothetical protein
MIRLMLFRGKFHDNWNPLLVHILALAGYSYPGIWAVMRFGQTTAKAVREIKQVPAGYSYKIPKSFFSHPEI